MKRLFGAACAVVTLASHAGTYETIVDEKQIQAITDKIPAKGGTFATRAASLGITVQSITIQHVDKDDAEGDPFSRPGDIAYGINTNAANIEVDCNLLGSADINKRGNRYILESRTANWIVKGVCAAP